MWTRTSSLTCHHTVDASQKMDGFGRLRCAQFKCFHGANYENNGRHENMGGRRVRVEEWSCISWGRNSGWKCSGKTGEGLLTFSQLSSCSLWVKISAIRKKRLKICGLDDLHPHPYKNGNSLKQKRAQRCTSWQRQLWHPEWLMRWR